MRLLYSLEVSDRVAASITSYTMRQLPRGKLMQIALNYIELKLQLTTIIF